MIAGSTVASWQPWLLVLLVVPLAVAVWSWRAGTDVDTDAVTVRAALGRRRVPWSQVSGLVVEHGHVVAVLATGGRLTLTAVRPGDLPVVVAAAGQAALSTPPGQR